MTTVTRVNNVYLLEREYYAGLKAIDPFQDAVPCWQRYGMTQRDLDCGLYGFTNRYY